MNLWVFGASFAEILDEEDQWPIKCATLLNANLISLALGGSSLEYTYKKFNEIRPYVKENDVLIFNLTGIDRRWFLKDRPELSILLSTPEIQSDQNKAVENYRRYLDRPDIQEIYFNNFLNNVHALTKKLSLHTILLIFTDVDALIKQEEFPLFNISKGTLLNTTLDEIDKSNGFYDKIIEWMHHSDPRLNHLCKSNHDILVDKILNNYHNKTPIDLAHGFLKNNFTEQMMNDENFIKSELFNNAVHEKLYKSNKQERIDRIEETVANCK